MRILYIYDGDWPRGATRVVKETRSLSAAGHEVLLVCRNTTRSPRLERNDWMAIQRLPSVPATRLNYALNFPLFVSPVWLWTIYRAARRWRPHRVVVADLPLAPAAVWIGRALAVPVYYDMAEIYPEFLRSLWQVDRMRWSDRLVRNPAAAEWLEQYVLARVEKTFVVTPESKYRLVRFGVHPDRIILVGNTPDPGALRAAGSPPTELSGLTGRPLILFVGILIADRGVKEAVEAMTLVRREIPNAALVVVGDGTDRQRIQLTIDRLQLRDHVLLVGWKEHASLSSFYAHAHLGLLPFLDSSHIRLTLANKLFDYMGAGLPVVAVDVPPMRRILDETGAGLLYAPGDRGALARCIVTLLRDDGRRVDMGRRGRLAVATTYKWSEDERRFLEAFR